MEEKQELPKWESLRKSPTITASGGMICSECERLKAEVEALKKRNDYSHIVGRWGSAYEINAMLKSLAEKTSQMEEFLRNEMEKQQNNLGQRRLNNGM